MPSGVEIAAVVEVGLVAARNDNDAAESLANDVWQAAPHCGNLQELRLVLE